MITHTILEQHKTKHEYNVNVTISAHICRVFLRPATEKDQYDVMSLLQKELIPIRNERQYPGLQTAHYNTDFQADLQSVYLCYHFFQSTTAKWFNEVRFAMKHSPPNDIASVLASDFGSGVLSVSGSAFCIAQ